MIIGCQVPNSVTKNYFQGSIKFNYSKTVYFVVHVEDHNGISFIKMLTFSHAHQQINLPYFLFFYLTFMKP